MFNKILAFTVRALSIISISCLIIFIYFGKTYTISGNYLLFNLGLFVSWGVMHSCLSSTHFKKLFSNFLPTYYNRPFFVLISSVGLLGVIYHWQSLGGTIWYLSGIPLYFSTFIFLIATVGVVYNTYSIDYKEFIGVKALLLKKTTSTKTKQTPELSLNGMYAYCRHPTYFFLIILFWVNPFMTYAKLEFVTIATIYFIIGTFHEEKNLRKELGAQYDEYCKNVPMWLPRFTPWQPAQKNTHETNHCLIEKMFVLLCKLSPRLAAHVGYLIWLHQYKKVSKHNNDDPLF